MTNHNFWTNVPIFRIYFSLERFCFPGAPVYNIAEILQFKICLSVRVNIFWAIYHEKLIQWHKFWICFLSKWLSSVHQKFWWYVRYFLQNYIKMFFESLFRYFFWVLQFPYFFFQKNLIFIVILLLTMLYWESLKFFCLSFCLKLYLG